MLGFIKNFSIYATGGLLGIMWESILSSQVVSLPLQSVIQVANFYAAMDTLIDQDSERVEEWGINEH